MARASREHRRPPPPPPLKFRTAELRRPENWMQPPSWNAVARNYSNNGEFIEEVTLLHCREALLWIVTG